MLSYRPRFVDDKDLSIAPRRAQQSVECLPAEAAAGILEEFESQLGD
jgi:hypothetical protein